jgi:hypothetical protein
MHAPAHLRDAFCELVEGAESVADTFYNDRTRAQLEAMSADEQLWWLSGQLWNCTDILPGGYCGDLGLSQGSTYAQAARLIRLR